MRLNWRSAIGRRTRRFGEGGRVLDTFLDDDEVKVRTRLGSIERSESSIDGELGYRFCIPHSEIHYGRLYAGGQYCFKSNHHTDVNCASFGVEVYNNELNCIPSGVQMTLGARLCTNFNGQTEGILSLSLRKATARSRVCCQDPCSSIFIRMEDPIYRRIRPCVNRKGGETLVESLTTDEYPVDGIWVSYEANEADLQTQIQKALANGGKNTMIFVDGAFGADQWTLNTAQVLAGGNAFLTSRGKTSGVLVPWGNWGNDTTNLGILNSADPNQTLLQMQRNSSIDTLVLMGGLNGIENAPDATHLTIRNATLITLADGVFGTASILLTGADNSLIQKTRILGREFEQVGFSIVSSNGVQLRDISSYQVLSGHMILLSTDTLIDGLYSDSDGEVDIYDVLVNINSKRTTLQNFVIRGAGRTSFTSYYAMSYGGEPSSDTTIRNGRITEGVSEAINFGTNTGFNSISNVTIDKMESNGIHIGGNAVNFGITENMAIDNVTIRFDNPSIDQAGIVIQNGIIDTIETVSVNHAKIIGAGGLNEGFKILSQAMGSIINLSGSGNEVSNVSDFCDVTSPVGTINGEITYNGTSECPP